LASTTESASCLRASSWNCSTACADGRAVRRAEPAPGLEHVGEALLIRVQAVERGTELDQLGPLVLHRLLDIPPPALSKPAPLLRSPPMA
jgi:hypothetical protein